MLRELPSARIAKLHLVKAAAVHDPQYRLVLAAIPVRQHEAPIATTAIPRVQAGRQRHRVDRHRAPRRLVRHEKVRVARARAQGLEPSRDGVLAPRAELRLRGSTRGRESDEQYYC